MKSNKLAFFLLTSVFLVASCGPATSSSSSSSDSYYSTSESASSWVKGSGEVSSVPFSVSEDVYAGSDFEEPSSSFSLSSSDAFAYTDTTGTLTKDSIAYTVTNVDINANSGWFTLNQGGSFTNSTHYSDKRFAGMKVTFTRLTDFGYLLYKGSRYEVTSPNNAAYHLYSGVYLPFFDETGSKSQYDFFSVYAAVGRFKIDSIQLYTVIDNQPSAPTTKYVDFYSINDTHGAAEYNINSSSRTYQIGITRLSDYYLTNARKNPDGSVILSSGDMWQGSADSNLTKGQVMIDWMNLVGFESMAIGNHEFDWGVEAIANNSKLANFPFLGINIKDASGNRPSWSIPSKTIYRHGVKIGIVGAIGNLAGSIATASLGGYSFASSYASLVSDEADRLRKDGCKMVVVSVHNGSFDTKYCQNVDAVFEGHSHQKYYEVDSYGIPHMQCYANGSMVQHVRFELSDTGASLVDHDYLSSDYAKTALEEEPMTKEVYRYYLSKTSAIKNEVVGHTDSVYSKDALGAIGAKSLLDYMRSSFSGYTIVAALINGGGVRQTIPSGDITFGQIYATFPFDNENHLCSATGSTLKGMLNGGGFYGESSLTSSEIVSTTMYYFVTLSYTSEGSYASSLKIVERDTYFIRNVVADYFRNGGK